MLLHLIISYFIKKKISLSHIVIFLWSINRLIFRVRTMDLCSRPKNLWLWPIMWRHRCFTSPIFLSFFVCQTVVLFLTKKNSGPISSSFLVKQWSYFVNDKKTSEKEVNKPSSQTSPNIFGPVQPCALLWFGKKQEKTGQTSP